MITLSFFNYLGKTSWFIDSAYKENFVQGYNWSKWQDEAIRLYENPELLDNVDILTIVKYITLIIRKERFFEGFIANMIDNEFILKLLLRLKGIYDLKQF